MKEMYWTFKIKTPPSKNENVQKHLVKRVGRWTKKDLWMCLRCTYANSMNKTQCKICSASKPVAGSSRRPKANRTEQINALYGYNLSESNKRHKKATGKFVFFNCPCISIFLLLFWHLQIIFVNTACPDVESILRGNRALLKNAQSFVSSVKMELLDQPIRYKKFLEGLIKFSTGAWSKVKAIEVLQQSVASLNEELRHQLDELLSY